MSNQPFTTVTASKGNNKGVKMDQYLCASKICTTGTLADINISEADCCIFVPLSTTEQNLVHINYYLRK